MPNDTVVIRNTRSNKRIGTASVYEQAAEKKLNNKDTEILEKKQSLANESISETDQNDLTSEDDENKTNSLPIVEFFKFIGRESNVYIYECSFTTHCKQVK